MKTILPILIAFVLIISCDQETTTPIVYEVEPINMQGPMIKRDSVQTLKISRNSIDDSIAVHFPSGGTVTDVVLHRQTEYENWKNGRTDQRPESLGKDHESVNDSVEDGLRIDLTRLPDGNYVGEWVTCSLWFYTVVELKTNNKNVLQQKINSSRL